MTSSQLWLREMHGSKAWSLCGVNHTLSTVRAMDWITDLLTAPVQPWDALICTSAASRDVIQRLLERQSEYLSRRLGASRFVLPQLPIIPLGVDCDAQQTLALQRGPARAALGVGEDDVVVLFLGRMSFHSKAQPTPMYVALERLAGSVAESRRVVLVECGWSANDIIAGAFAEARARLCPSVRSIVLDGRDPSSRVRAWAAADIFCSLSDNIQESFGLTPIEAMAAGLPVVVTDWDGYRDTVRDGIDGIAIPTMFPPAGAGTGAAARHALGWDSHHQYIGQVAATTAVDVEATARAFQALAADPELRRRMGASGAARARELYDWKVVVRAYEDLWARLAELRRSAGGAPLGEPAAWPGRPDPFELFASFPSSVISDRHRVRIPAGIGEREALARLGVRVSMLDLNPEIPPSAVLGLWRSLGPDPRTVETVVDAQSMLTRSGALRALLILAKAGLVEIGAP